MTHSDEAIAAYPGLPEAMSDEHSDHQTKTLRTAFDAGRASVQAQQYAATRKQIAQWIIRDMGSTRQLDEYIDEVQAEFLSRADALLASTGPLLDAGEVWDASMKAELFRLSKRIQPDGMIDQHELMRPVANPYREASI